MMTTKQRILFGLIIFLLGLIGVFSLLTMDIVLPDAAVKALERFTPAQIKLLILINPTIMLLIAVILGTILHDKVNLDSPLIKSIVTKDRKYELTSILKYGLIGGVISGVFITLIAAVFAPYLPSEMSELSNNMEITLANRFLYGGITEEILMRFGLMTLVVWFAFKIFKSQSSKIYWVGIIFSSLIFGFGHFPVMFNSIADPSILLMLYILVGNSIGGMIFGWLYWKKGLESAMIAHIFTHIVMVSAIYL